MSWSRANSRILMGAVFAGLLVSLIVAGPRWTEDSRMVLEVRFESPPIGEGPAFRLRYDRGRGMNSLRVVDPVDVRTEDPHRFRWVFDARPINRIQVGIAGWQGPLAIQSAVVKDVAGRELYRFDPLKVSLASGEKEYPVELGEAGTYYRLILPVEDGEQIPRLQRFSRESVLAVTVAFLLGAGVFWFCFQLCRKNPMGIRSLAFVRADYLEWSETTRPPRAVLLSSLLVLAVLVLLRSWENFLHPSLFVEDAFHYFNYFYGGRISFVDGILRNPNGYFNILPNLIAWSLARVDVRWIPGAYVGFAVAFALFASVLPAATGRFRSRWILFVLPLVLGLSGMNHIFYYTTLTFQMYVTVLVLLVMMFLPSPRSATGTWAQILIGVLLVFSGPYTVVAVPTAVLLLLFFRPCRQSFFWASMAFAGVAFLETSAGLVRLQNALELSVLERMATVMIERVFFFDWNVVGMVSGAVLVVVTISLVYGLLWRDSEFRRIGTVFLAIVILAMAPLFLSQKFLFYSDPYDCHVLISQFFWLLFLLYAADGLAIRFGAKIPLAPVLALLFLAFVWMDQEKNPAKGHFPPNREMVPFMEKVRQAEMLRLEEVNEFVLLEGTGASQPAFQPRVRVGSMRSDAQQRQPEELGLTD